jgi:pyrimidine-nucleoside phosphorylase
MVDIGKRVGRKVRAVISDMNQPLGNAVGNALELKEALDTLRGHGPADFRKHCLTVAGQMLQLTGQAENDTDAKAQLEELLNSQQALAKFREWIVAQHGDQRSVDDPELLPAARFQRSVPAPRSGFVSGVNAREVGLTSMLLGGGRAKKGDSVDHAVGIVLQAKVGDHVVEGDPLLTIHANDEAKLAGARQRLLSAYEWSDQEVSPPPLLHQTVG